MNYAFVQSTYSLINHGLFNYGNFKLNVGSYIAPVPGIGGNGSI